MKCRILQKFLLIVKVDVRKANFIFNIYRNFSWPSFFERGGNKEKDWESLGRQLALQRRQGCSVKVVFFAGIMENSVWKKQSSFLSLPTHIYGFIESMWSTQQKVCMIIISPLHICKATSYARCLWNSCGVVTLIIYCLTAHEVSKQIVRQFSCEAQDSVVYQYCSLETSKQFDKGTRPWQK